MTQHEQVTQFHKRRLSGLIGAQIVSVAVEDYDGEAITVLTVRTVNGTLTTLAPLRDAEGNGPGWLDFDPEGKLSSKVSR